MVGSNTIHCARADTVTPTVTSASAMYFFMVCLSLSCRCQRRRNHEKGFTTKRRRRGVSGAQDSMKSVERNANGHVSVQDTSTERIGYCQAKAAPNTASSTMGLSAKPNFCRFARDKKYFKIAIDNFDLVVHIHIKMSKDLDMARVENCVCFNLRWVARAVTQFYDSEMRRHGVRPTQGTILLALNSKESWSMAELSDWRSEERRVGKEWRCGWG